MEYVVSFSLIFLEICSLDNLISACFEKDRGMVAKLSCFILHSLIMLFFVTRYLASLSTVKFAVMIFVFAIVFHFLYKAKYFQITAISLVWYAIYLATDVFGMACYTRIFSLTFDQWQASMIHFIVYSVVARLTFCCSTYFFKMWYQKRYKTEFVTQKEWLIIAVYPVVTFLVIFATVYPALITDKLTDGLLLANTALVFSNFILLYWIGIINSAHTTRQELLLAKEKMRIEKEFRGYLNSSYARQRSLTHDFNNNLLVIKNMSEAGELSAVQGFISELVKSSSVAPLVVKSNNTAADAILNQKHEEAVALGIGVEYTINDLSQLPMSDLDVVTVLANVLDNAIAAAEQTEQKAIWVRFTCRGGETLLRVSNSVAKKVKICRDEIVTTKEDKLAFGYGIKNTKNALEKYGGTFSLECDDEIFVMTIVL